MYLKDLFWRLEAFVECDEHVHSLYDASSAELRFYRDATLSFAYLGLSIWYKYITPLLRAPNTQKNVNWYLKGKSANSGGEIQ